MDDRLHSHPKASHAGLEALGLHLLAMSHTAAYRGEGHVPSAFPKEKAGSKGSRLARRLVEAGLWEVNGDGWMIHDWLQYNPSNAEADAVADAKRRAGRASGRSRAHA